MRVTRRRAAPESADARAAGLGELRSQLAVANSVSKLRDVLARVLDVIDGG